MVFEFTITIDVVVTLATALSTLIHSITTRLY